MSTDHRNVCYMCFRPQSSCMCTYITPLHTRTRFIILMHPKEFKKTKNGTGHFTHLSLSNSEIFIGIDFSEHDTVNKIINNPSNHCYLLYPHTESISLNKEDIGKKGEKTVLFLLDATWPCSRAMLSASPNINTLEKVSFTHDKVSGFQFKQQPKEYCLSTMESTLCVLKLLNEKKIENIATEKLNTFLLPFEKMVKYQLSYNTI